MVGPEYHRLYFRGLQRFADEVYSVRGFTEPVRAPKAASTVGSVSALLFMQQIVSHSRFFWKTANQSITTTNLSGD
jgi:hypothetical protein